LRGATMSMKLQQALKLVFQSTHPLRGATRAMRLHLIQDSHFNPHTPCGVRPCHTELFANPCLFQSTHPLRGATSNAFAPAREYCISIHTPLAGCDRLSLTYQPVYIEFQSTHPLRGAT